MRISFHVVQGNAVLSKVAGGSNEAEPLNMAKFASLGVRDIFAEKGEDKLDTAGVLGGVTIGLVPTASEVLKRPVIPSATEKFVHWRT